MKSFFHEQILPFLLRVLGASSVMFLFWQVASFYKARILNKLEQDISKAPATEKETMKKTNLVYYELSNLMYFALLFIGASISLSILGVSNTTILTIVGATGLAMSLSLQSYLTGVVSGIEVSLNDWYSIGDNIRVLTTGHSYIEGKVIDFNLLRTTLYTPTQQVVTLPNDMITKSVIYYVDTNKK